MLPLLNVSTEPVAAGGPRPRLAPAVAAALIQVLAAAPTLGTLYLLGRLHYSLPLYGVALLQGALAAIVTERRRMAPWWCAIQLLFPVALVGADALHPPPAALLGVFLFLVLLFWSTFRTQVPFYPSGLAARQAVAALLPTDRAVRLIDVGSGLGGLVLDLARSHPGSELSGIELAPLPWLVSVLRSRVTGSAARFIRGNYERLDFANYDVVFAYLSPAAMTALWHKAKREMRPATMLVSYEFTSLAKAPDKTIAATRSGPATYVWYF